MKTFKKLLAIIPILGIGVSVMADTATLTLTGVNTNNVILTGPAKLLSLTIQSTATTNGLLNFYDSPYGTNTITVGAYTNYTRTVATTNIVYTNVFGVIATNSYPVVRYTTNTATGGQQLRKLVYTYSTVSNSYISVDFDAGEYLAGGLLVTNISTLGGAPGGGVLINVEYEKLK